MARALVQEQARERVPAQAWAPEPVGESSAERALAQERAQVLESRVLAQE